MLVGSPLYHILQCMKLSPVFASNDSDLSHFFFFFFYHEFRILGANSAGIFVRTFRDKFRITTLRKMVQSFATLITAGFLIALMFLENHHNVAAALTFMVCVMACFAMGQAGYWSALQDISPQFAGNKFISITKHNSFLKSNKKKHKKKKGYTIGFGNTVGSVAGFLSNFFTGWLLKKYPGEWWIVFSSILGTSITGTVLWDIFGSAEQVDFSS